MLPSFAYSRPKKLSEAFEQLSDAQARPLAGGTDLLGCLREGVLEVPSVVSLSAIEPLKGISETADGGLRIGALATITEVAENELVKKRYPALAEAAVSVASPQLRNQGTLGGNLCQKPRCWYYRGEFHCLRKGGEFCYAAAGENAGHSIFGGEPCYIVHPSDTAPALGALGAQLRIVGPKGSRDVPLEDFHVLPSVDAQRETVLEPGELLSEVLLPAPAEGMRSTYRKVRSRASWDFALVGAAIALRMAGAKVKEARVFLSGVAPVPWRSEPVEQALSGQTLDAAAIEKAAAASGEGADPLEQNGYKVPLLKGLVRERLEVLAKNG